MRHSIFSVIVLGVLLGAMFFFMPHLVIGIFIILVIIRLLHFAFMGHGYDGHGYYGRGYDRGCDCRYGRRYDSCRDGGYGDEHERKHDFHHDHHHGHYSGHGPVHEHLFYWVDKVRNMSEEEFAEFKNKMDKGFGYGYRGRYGDSYEKCNCGEKGKDECDCESTEKKEETIK